MNKDLYQTIEELKATLANIDSARKQVSDTVTAYSATQQGIQSYVEKLESIEKVMKKFFVLLQNNKVMIEQQASSAVAGLKITCNEISARNKQEQETIFNSFSEKLASKLEEVDRQVDVFNGSIKRAELLTKTRWLN